MALGSASDSQLCEVASSRTIIVNFSGFLPIIIDLCKGQERFSHWGKL